LFGSLLRQSAGIFFVNFEIASMSEGMPSVTISASIPSITARACAPEPPCDARTVTVSPVRAFHSSEKA
jgi:hypothetical protein